MSSLSRNCYNQLYQTGTIIDVPKGHSFTIETHGTNHIYCLQSGVCALVRHTTSGKEIVYYYFKEGDVLGVARFNLLHHNQGQSISHGVNYTIVAKTNCIMSRVPFEKAHALIEANPDIASFFNYAVSNYYLSILNHLHSSKESCTDTRLYSLLLHLAVLKDDTYMIHKHFTYVEMAKYLGVHYVTISRIMAQLKQDGIISKLGHNTIITDIDTLSRLAHNPIIC